jgi:hypothetical protein
MTNKPPIQFDFDLASWEADLDKIGEAAAGEALGRTVEAIGLRIEAKAKVNAANVLNKHPTGFLISTIQTQKPVVEGLYAECDVNVGAEYGAIHEFGGIIRATNGPYLTFRTEDGEWHSVPSVLMPARPYMRPAIDDEADLQAVGEAALAEEIRKAVG